MLTDSEHTPDAVEVMERVFRAIGFRGQPEELFDTILGSRSSVAELRAAAIGLAAEAALDIEKKLVERGDDDVIRCVSGGVRVLVVACALWLASRELEVDGFPQ